MSTPETKDRIFDAAEQLFAERGFDAISLRRITSEAGVNLAAIHYHFGSKEALILAVLERHIEVINRQRHALLDDLEAAASGRPVALEAVIRAFVQPAIELCRGANRNGERLMRLFGFAHTEPGDYFIRLFLERHQDLIVRFVDRLAAALPGASREEVFWNLHFMVGLMASTMASARKIERLAPGMIDTSDTDAIVERIVSFLAAGMRGTRRTRRTRRRGSRG